MANSRRKCFGCGEKFDRTQMRFPTGSLQGHCFNPDCGTKLAMHLLDKKKKATAKRIEKEERAELKNKREAARSRSWYVKEAQKWFNKFIRLRDADLPCICCDTPSNAQIQWHAGHFLTTGARPEHRFNEDNCHKQTSRCNNYLSGNVAEYRKRLILKIGIARVEAIEQDHAPKKYTVDELKEIIAKYKARVKELENAQNN